MKRATKLLSAFGGVLLAASFAGASSHREAPGILYTPAVDGTDFYMFNSYETGRSGFITIVANYYPLQAPGGGPNYYPLDPNAIYEIELDTVGDASEHITYQFKFTNTYHPTDVTVGTGANAQTEDIPLIVSGQVTAPTNPSSVSNIGRTETYTVTQIVGPRRTGTATAVTQSGSSNTTFVKPMDNIGNKAFPNYTAYANQYMYNINVPGSSQQGRVFVGQRSDPFVVNLGETFDLVNDNPLGPANAHANTLANANVTSIILEIPKDSLKFVNGNTIVGGWTSSSVVDATQTTGYRQVSRLGAPLVNEVVIGVEDKDKWNGSVPSGDGQFAKYVTNPTLPPILQILFGVRPPTSIPRQDLVQGYLTGFSGLNMPAGVTACEELRLNTDVTSQSFLAIKAPAQQNSLGCVAQDYNGFPNGRRPGDDVVDISLRLLMGVFATSAPDGQLPYTDGAAVNATQFLSAFPYINAPHPGSP